MRDHPEKPAAVRPPSAVLVPTTKPSAGARRPSARFDPGIRAYFEMVELCKSIGISGLVEQGLSRMKARREWARLQKERFSRKDPPWLVERARKAGIWGLPTVEG